MSDPVIPGLSAKTYEALDALGYSSETQFTELPIADLLDAGISWGQVHKIINWLIDNGRTPVFRGPGPIWDEEKWQELVAEIVRDGIVTWQEVAVAVLGELNPPQVGTRVASNPNIKALYPPREAMRNVMEWLYDQDGRCANCGSRIHIEVDHIEGRDSYVKSGRDPALADRLDNLQLLCRRCNVVKRESHRLGGLSFATAQAALMWILLVERPPTQSAFTELCRAHGLTMASIRFQEAWAMAEWLEQAGMFP
jgi:5-methylcytosine-specific restriction endonuclease McrA